MLKVRQAVWEDIPAVVELYDGVIDLFQAQTGNMGWRKGVYPTEADFRRAVRAGTPPLLRSPLPLPLSNSECFSARPGGRALSFYNNNLEVLYYGNHRERCTEVA